MRLYLALSIIIVLVSYAVYLGFTNGGLNLGVIGKIKATTKKISNKLGKSGAAAKNSTVVASSADGKKNVTVSEAAKKAADEKDEDEENRKELEEKMLVLRNSMAPDE